MEKKKYTDLNTAFITKIGKNQIFFTYRRRKLLKELYNHVFLCIKDLVYGGIL